VRVLRGVVLRGSRVVGSRTSVRMCVIRATPPPRTAWPRERSKKMLSTTVAPSVFLTGSHGRTLRLATRQAAPRRPGRHVAVVWARRTGARGGGRDAGRAGGGGRGGRGSSSSGGGGGGGEKKAPGQGSRSKAKPPEPKKSPWAGPPLDQVVIEVRKPCVHPRDAEVAWCVVWRAASAARGNPRERRGAVDRRWIACSNPSRCRLPSRGVLLNVRSRATPAQSS
jgi:hypothetical protein